MEVHSTIICVTAKYDRLRPYTGSITVDLGVSVVQVNQLKKFSLCVKKFREDINGYNDENYKNKILQVLSQLNIFISSTEIHKEKRKELEETMELIQTSIQNLIVNIIVMFVFIYLIFIL